MNLNAHPELPNVRGMKTFAKSILGAIRLTIMLALITMGSTATVDAADARTQAARDHADRQGIKNDLKRVQADVAELIESQNALLRELSELKTTVKNQAAEIRRLSADLAQERARNATKYASFEDIKTLADKLQELDIKRKKDADLVVKELTGLSKQHQTSLDQFDKRTELLNNRLSAVERAQALKPTTTPRPPAEQPKPTVKPPATPEGVFHTIAEGEFVGRIVAAYNDAWKAQGYKGLITFDALKKANPKINLDRVQIGQQIFIPVPGK